MRCRAALIFLVFIFLVIFVTVETRSRPESEPKSKETKISGGHRVGSHHKKNRHHRPKHDSSSEEDDLNYGDKHGKHAHKKNITRAHRVQGRRNDTFLEAERNFTAQAMMSGNSTHGKYRLFGISSNIINTDDKKRNFTFTTKSKLNSSLPNSGNHSYNSSKLLFNYHGMPNNTNDNKLNIGFHNVSLTKLNLNNSLPDPGNESHNGSKLLVNYHGMSNNTKDNIGFHNVSLHNNTKQNVLKSNSTTSSYGWNITKPLDSNNSRGFDNQYSNQFVSANGNMLPVSQYYESKLYARPSGNSLNPPSMTQTYHNIGWNLSPNKPSVAETNRQYVSTHFAPPPQTGWVYFPVQNQTHFNHYGSYYPNYSYFANAKDKKKKKKFKLDLSLEDFSLEDVNWKELLKETGKNYDGKLKKLFQMKKIDKLPTRRLYSAKFPVLSQKFPLDEIMLSRILPNSETKPSLVYYSPPHNPKIFAGLENKSSNLLSRTKRDLSPHGQAMANVINNFLLHERDCNETLEARRKKRQVEELTVSKVPNSAKHNGPQEPVVENIQFDNVEAVVQGDFEISVFGGIPEISFGRDPIGQPSNHEHFDKVTRKDEQYKKTENDKLNIRGGMESLFMRQQKLINPTEEISDFGDNFNVQEENITPPRIDNGPSSVINNKYEISPDEINIEGDMSPPRIDSENYKLSSISETNDKTHLSRANVDSLMIPFNTKDEVTSTRIHNIYRISPTKNEEKILPPRVNGETEISQSGNATETQIAASKNDSGDNTSHSKVNIQAKNFPSRLDNEDQISFASNNAKENVTPPKIDDKPSRNRTLLSRVNETINQFLNRRPFTGLTKLRPVKETLESWRKRLVKTLSTPSVSSIKFVTHRPPVEKNYGTTPEVLRRSTRSLDKSVEKYESLEVDDSISNVFDKIRVNDPDFKPNTKVMDHEPLSSEINRDSELYDVPTSDDYDYRFNSSDLKETSNSEKPEVIIKTLNKIIATTNEFNNIPENDKANISMLVDSQPVKDTTARDFKSLQPLINYDSQKLSTEDSGDKRHREGGELSMYNYQYNQMKASEHSDNRQQENNKKNVVELSNSPVSNFTSFEAVTRDSETMASSVGKNTVSTTTSTEATKKKNGFVPVSVFGSSIERTPHPKEELDYDSSEGQGSSGVSNLPATQFSKLIHSIHTVPQHLNLPTPQKPNINLLPGWAMPTREVLIQAPLKTLRCPKGYKKLRGRCRVIWT